jgi:hypothetical protein
MAKPILGHEAPFQYDWHIFRPPPLSHFRKLTSRVKQPGPALPDAPFISYLIIFVWPSVDHVQNRKVDCTDRVMR